MCRWVLGLCLLLASGTASAHNRSVSYSTWTIAGNELVVDLRLPTSNLNPLGLDPADAHTAEVLAGRVGAQFLVWGGDTPCVVQHSAAHRSGAIYRVRAQWHCDVRATRLRSEFLRDAIPGHLHLLQWRADDALQGPYALNSAQPELIFRAAPPETSQYLGLGVEHILLGWDHLAFLVVLLLGAATWRQLAWRVTGFTLGHSLTLALAALANIHPAPALIESFIALTIVCTAAERVFAGQPHAIANSALLAAVLAAIGVYSGTLPWTLMLAAVLLSFGAYTDARLDGLRTALFGLFHGFGFASVLGALNAGQAIPPLPLFAFNLGVELGQLAFVIPLWWLTRRWTSLRAPWVPAAVLALGTAWYLQRLA